MSLGSKVVSTVGGVPYKRGVPFDLVHLTGTYTNIVLHQRCSAGVLNKHGTALVSESVA